MKNIIIAATTLVCLCAAALNMPRNVTFAWDTPSTNVVAFNFYEIVPGATNLISNTTNTVLSVTNIIMATPHTYVVTALDAFGFESLPSVPLTIANPSAPMRLRVNSVP